MYQIEIRHQDLSKKLPYGLPVATFDEVHTLLEKLEEEWTDWQDKGFPQLPPTNAVQLLEGSEIYIVSEDGKEYWLDENSNFVIMN